MLLVAALFVAGRLLDMNAYLQAIQEWMWQFGAWGPIVFVGLYVGAMLVLLPGTPFTILAAFLFGNLWGFATMMAAATLAATLAFVMARYLFRDTDFLRRFPIPTLPGHIDGGLASVAAINHIQVSRDRSTSIRDTHP